MDTNLSKRMMKIADENNLNLDHELRVKAADFDKKSKGFYSENQTVNVKQFLGSYARAKRALSEFTGEGLV